MSEEEKKLSTDNLIKPMEIQKSIEIEVKVGTELSHNGKKYKLLKKIMDTFFETVYLAQEESSQEKYVVK